MTMPRSWRRNAITRGAAAATLQSSAAITICVSRYSRFTIVIHVTNAAVNNAVTPQLSPADRLAMTSPK